MTDIEELYYARANERAAALKAESQASRDERAKLADLHGLLLAKAAWLDLQGLQIRAYSEPQELVLTHAKFALSIRRAAGKFVVSLTPTIETNVRSRREETATEQDEILTVIVDAMLDAGT